LIHFTFTLQKQLWVVKHSSLVIAGSYFTIHCTWQSKGWRIPSRRELFPIWIAWQSCSVQGTSEL